jgi:hypothetical protein
MGESRALDEHWDGHGYPEVLSGEANSALAGQAHEIRAGRTAARCPPPPEV